MCCAVALANLCTFFARLCPRAVALAFLYASSEAKDNTGFTYNSAMRRAQSGKKSGAARQLSQFLHDHSFGNVPRGSAAENKKIGIYLWHGLCAARQRGDKSGVHMFPASSRKKSLSLGPKLTR